MLARSPDAAFAPRETNAPLSDFTLVSLGKTLDNFVDFSHLGHLDDLIKCRVRMRGDQVFVNGARKQTGFLRNYTEINSYLIRREIGNVIAV
jgi:hypothetical protein